MSRSPRRDELPDNTTLQSKTRLELLDICAHHNISIDKKSVRQKIIASIEKTRPSEEASASAHAPSIMSFSQSDAAKPDRARGAEKEEMDQKADEPSYGSA